MNTKASFEILVKASSLCLLSGVTQRVTRVSRSVTHIFFITLLRAHMREKKSHIITHSDISVTKICVKNVWKRVKRVKCVKMCVKRVENIHQFHPKKISIACKHRFLQPSNWYVDEEKIISRDFFIVFARGCTFPSMLSFLKRTNEDFHMKIYTFEQKVQSINLSWLILDL